MGPTRIRDLTATVVVVTVFSYLLVVIMYRWFPPITLWSGLPMLAGAVAEAGWAFYLRSKISNGEIGVGGGRIHPLTVARSVVLAKASAWLGALMAGWWIGIVAYLLPRRGTLPIPRADTPGAIVAAVGAVALAVAALWLQHCCKSPEEPPDSGDTAPQ